MDWIEQAGSRLRSPMTSEPGAERKEGGLGNVPFSLLGDKIKTKQAIPPTKAEQSEYAVIGGLIY